MRTESPSLDGEVLKERAHQLLEATRGELIADGRRALLRCLIEHGTATIEDARSEIKIPPGINPTALGAVPGALAKAGIIRQHGFVRTSRLKSHARPVALWTLVDADAARRWIELNPPMPMPMTKPRENDRVTAVSGSSEAIIEEAVPRQGELFG